MGFATSVRGEPARASFVVRGGEVVVIRHMMYGILTYDHRIIDGADAARFLVTVKNRLEEGDFAAELGL